VVRRYQVLHLHFGLSGTRSGWDLPVAKRLGQTIVAHFRGCEVRNPDTLLERYGDGAICADCDYGRVPCRARETRERVTRVRRWADAVLVTTPDLLEFVPEAEHLPFFPPEPLPEPAPPPEHDGFVVVHATNHPGIEGTDRIRAAVERLQARGYPVTLEVVSGRPPQEVLQACARADLAVGKLKMGYYANAQIESAVLGVPTVTRVRPEFMTPELAACGLVFSTLADLEQTLAGLLGHPLALQGRRQRTRRGILALHDSARLARRLIGVYLRRPQAPAEGDGPAEA